MTKKLHPSMRSAAKQMNISYAALKRLKAEGCAGFNANNSVDPDEVRKWMRENPKAVEAASARADLECRKLKAICQKLEHEFETIRAQYIPREDYDADCARVAGLFEKTLLAFHADQVGWQGLTAVERDKKGKESIRRLLTDLKKELAR